MLFFRRQEGRKEVLGCCQPHTPHAFPFWERREGRRRLGSLPHTRSLPHYSPLPSCTHAPAHLASLHLHTRYYTSPHHHRASLFLLFHACLLTLPPLLPLALFLWEGISCLFPCCPLHHKYFACLLLRTSLFLPACLLLLGEGRASTHHHLLPATFACHFLMHHHYVSYLLTCPARCLPRASYQGGRQEKEGGWEELTCLFHGNQGRKEELEDFAPHWRFLLPSASSALFLAAHLCCCGGARAPLHSAHAVSYHLSLSAPLFCLPARRRRRRGDLYARPLLYASSLSASPRLACRTCAISFSLYLSFFIFAGRRGLEGWEGLCMLPAAHPCLFPLASLPHLHLFHLFCLACLSAPWLPVTTTAAISLSLSLEKGCLCTACLSCLCIFCPLLPLHALHLSHAAPTACCNTFPSHRRYTYIFEDHTFCPAAAHCTHGRQEEGRKENAMPSEEEEENTLFMHARTISITACLFFFCLCIPSRLSSLPACPTPISAGRRTSFAGRAEDDGLGRAEQAGTDIPHMPLSFFACLHGRGRLPACHIFCLPSLLTVKMPASACLFLPLPACLPAYLHLSASCLPPLLGRWAGE